MSNRPRFQRVVAAMAMCALAGCGTTPPPEAAGPNVVQDMAIQDMAIDLASAQDQISAYRRSHGLSAVAVDDALVAMAQRQADGMASADHLSHDIAGSLVSRLAGAGLPRGAAVENVSAGYGSISETLSGWRRSAMHNANLLDPQMRHMGIAAAVAPSTRYKRYWALVMTQ